jgi:hypothetical protein
VQSRFLGERFLRPAFLPPKQAQVFGEPIADIHPHESTEM